MASRPAIPQHRLVFGQHLRRLRRDRGLSQEALALVAGLDRSYLGQVERGERNVALDNIVKIAAALQLTAAELLATEPPI